MNYKKSVKVAVAIKGEKVEDYCKFCGVSTQAMYKRFHRKNPMWSWVKSVADYAGVTVEEVEKWGN